MSAKTAKKVVVSTATEPADAPRRQWLRMQIGDLTVEGYSRAADKTFLLVPQLQLALDAGLCFGKKARCVLLTHTHSDHSTDLAILCKRRRPVATFCPAEAAENVRLHVDAFIRMTLNGERFDPALTPYTVVGVAAGQEFDLPDDCGGRGNISVEVFDLVHTVPCRGYGLRRRKKRLAERLRGMTGKEIAARRAAGEAVDEVVLDPVLAFLGDTSIEGVLANPGLFRYPAVIVECSFFPVAGQTQQQEDVVEAKKDKHVHWNDLRPVIAAHPETTFVLIHCSLRYSAAEVLAFLQRDAADLPNVIPFIPETRL